MERAVKLVRERLDLPSPSDKWWDVARTIDTAAQTMNPANQSAQIAVDAAAKQADYSEPGPGVATSAVAREQVLGNIQAACVGR
jgi:hypothetical protein